MVTGPLYCLNTKADSFSVPERYKFIYDGHIRNGTEKEVRNGIPCESVTLRRTSCFGNCPSYSVTFNRSGEAVYEGVSHVDMKGIYNGEVGLFDFGRLCYAIERIGFLEMEKDYIAPWTDDSAAIVRVENAGSGQVSEVSDYGRQAHPEFWLLTNTIDSLSKRIDWVAKE